MYGKTAVIVGQNFPDSSSDFIVDHNDSIFIFEPIHEAAVSCWERYSWTGKVAIVEAACGLTPGFSPFYIYNTQGLSSSLGKVTRQAKELYAKCNLDLKEVRKVLTLNLGTFLTGVGVEKIEILKIDAQGMDLTILQTVEGFVRRGDISVIECEADGEGFRHYSDLPTNAVVGFQSLMSQYPRYQFSLVPDRNQFNPDLRWELACTS